MYLHRPRRIVHLHPLLCHHIQLFQRVWVLRVDDVADVLQGGAPGQCAQRSVPAAAAVGPKLNAAVVAPCCCLCWGQRATHLKNLQRIYGLPLRAAIHWRLLQGKGLEHSQSGSRNRSSGWPCVAALASCCTLHLRLLALTSLLRRVALRSYSLGAGLMSSI